MAEKASNVPKAYGAGLWPAMPGLMESFFRDMGTGFGSQFAPLFSPNVEVNDADGHYEVTIELPGVDEKDIDVSVHDGVLTIKGEKKESKERKDKSVYFSERRYGSFQRSFRLPDEADPEEIKAHVSKGVLSVTIGKSKSTPPSKRKIEVKAGD